MSEKWRESWEWGLRIPQVTGVQYVRSDPKHSDDLKKIKEEVFVSQELGIDVEFKEGLQVKG